MKKLSQIHFHKPGQQRRI